MDDCLRHTLSWALETHDKQENHRSGRTVDMLNRILLAAAFDNLEPVVLVLVKDMLAVEHTLHLFLQRAETANYIAEHARCYDSVAIEETNILFRTRVPLGFHPTTPVKKQWLFEDHRRLADRMRVLISDPDCSIYRQGTE